MAGSASQLQGPYQTAPYNDIEITDTGFKITSNAGRTNYFYMAVK